MNLIAVKDFIINILYPQKCAFCEDITDNNTVICERCKKIVEKYKIKSNFNFIDKKYNFAKNVLSVFEYNDITSRAILRLKNIGDKEVIELSGEYLCNKFNENFVKDDIDLIISVPMYRLKQKMKGFNHSNCIAKNVAEKLCIPLNTSALIKVKDNKTQHFLSESERHQNILGVYKVNKKVDIKGKNILIIDDVMTTGSTLSECSKILYQAGAKNVSTLVVCATMGNNS